MTQEIATLIQLQKLDRKLDEIERSKGDLPKQVAELEAELQRARDHLAETDSEISETALEKKRLELETASLREKKKQNEEKLYSVQSNKEYDAVTVEIETVVERIDELETGTLELIEKEETLAEQRTAAQEQVDKLAGDFQTRSDELNARIQANADREAKLRSERDGLHAQVSAQHQRLYRRIRGGKDGLAIVPILRDSCGGCYTQIPPQRLMEVREAERLITCESCGRMLYWDGEKAPASAA